MNSIASIVTSDTGIVIGWASSTQLYMLSTLDSVTVTTKSGILASLLLEQFGLSLGARLDNLKRPPSLDDIVSDDHLSSGLMI